MDDDLYEFEDLFRFPWELNEELDLLRHRWQNLYNQVIGRGSNPRDDINSEVQDKVTKDYNEFRFWETNLGLGQRFTSSFNDELNNYKALLVADLKMVTEWLAEYLPSEVPPVPINPDEPGFLGYKELIIGTLAVVVGGYLTYRLLKVIK